MGIVHCDLKTDNIMMDFNGRIKIIDFGISYYLGIPKLNIFNEPFICQDVYDPIEQLCVDTFDFNSIIIVDENLNILLNEDNTFFKFESRTIVGRYKDFLNDVHRVGNIILCQLIGIFFNIVYYQGYFYDIKLKRNPLTNIYLITLTRLSDKYFSNIDVLLLDVLKNMIQLHYDDRIQAKECLNYEYFTGVTSLYSNEKELIYSEDYFNIFKDYKFTSFNLHSKEYFKMVNYILELCDNHCRSIALDVYINTIDLLKRVFNCKDITLNDENIKKYTLVVFFISNSMLKQTDFNFNDFVDTYEELYDEKDFEKCFVELNHKIDVYTFTHVRPIINNFITELKLIDVDETLINEIYETLFLHVIKFSIYEKSNEITICDVVKKSYLEIIEEYDNMVPEDVLISFIERKLN